jgi:hypothetical protein
MNRNMMNLLRVKRILLDGIFHADKEQSFKELIENCTQHGQTAVTRLAINQLLEEQMIQSDCSSNIYQLEAMKFSISDKGKEFLEFLSNEDRFTTAEVICEKLGDFNTSTFLNVYKKLQEKEMDELVDKFCGSSWEQNEDGKYKRKNFFSAEPDTK